MKFRRPRISARMSRAISPSRPRATRPVKKVCASDTGSEASSAIDLSRQRTARATRFRRSPSQTVQTLASPSYQAFQAVSSPVCSSSKPCSCRPVPKQPVHQPCLELYENRRGSGSGKLVPQDGQARLTEKCCCWSSLFSASCSLFTGQTMDMTPWPFSSALLTAARRPASLAGSTTTSATGSSIVCSL
ncbi:hypothetical protein D9M72_507610 [compost metagenome]